MWGVHMLRPSTVKVHMPYRGMPGSEQFNLFANTSLRDILTLNSAYNILADDIRKSLFELHRYGPQHTSFVPTTINLNGTEYTVRGTNTLALQQKEIQDRALSILNGVA